MWIACASPIKSPNRLWWTSIPRRSDRPLRNLLLNAGHAIAERTEKLMSADGVSNGAARTGKLFVSLRAVTSTSDGSAPAAYMLTVDDNGPGVRPEIRERLWEPFYTTKARGTGLGLSQVRQAVEAHGGTATIDEVPGGDGGARFTLCLPAARLDTPAPTPGILPSIHTDILKEKHPALAVRANHSTYGT